MSSLASESLTDLVRKSGLVESSRLDDFLARQDASATARQLADRLVAEELVTPWQARQLLQGRYRGFFLGPYRLLDQLGAGGMGSVLLAEHTLMLRRVAVKVLPPRMALDPGALERFHREARAVAALDHPNIVRAFDISKEGAVHYLVMEYVEGKSLQAVLDHGPVPVGLAAEYGRQVALGLQHAHEKGIVHRDLKPANILVDRKGVVKILDLGLARFFNHEAGGKDEVTRKYDVGTVLGTADYLSPEQAVDSSAVDIRSDIYSLGVTLYALLTGKPPFDDLDTREKLLAHHTRQPRPVRESRPDVPSGLAMVVHTMMAKNPDDRFQTPAEVAFTLARWAEPSQPKTRRLPVPAAAAAGVAVETHETAALPTVPVQTPQFGAVRPSRTVLYSSLAAAGGAAAVLLLLWVHPSRWESDPPAPPPPQASDRTDVAGPGGYLPRFAPHRLIETDRFVAAPFDAQALAVSPDGVLAAAGGGQGDLALHDLKSARPARPLAGHTDTVTAAAFSPDGRYLLSGSRDHTARLWDAAHGREVRKLLAGDAAVSAVHFAPDGRRALTAAGGSLRTWEVRTGKLELAWELPAGTAATAAFSPDGRLVAAAGSAGTVYLFDAATGSERLALAGSREPARHLALAADGRHLLAGFADGTARLWEVPSGRLLWTAPSHGTAVESVAFSPDGRLALTTEGARPTPAGPVVGTDQGIRLWDVASGTLIDRRGGLPCAVSAAAFTPDGAKVVAACSDGLVRVLSVE